MPAVTIPQALHLAVQHHQAGRLADAEVLYRQILAVQPNHAEALYHLGLVAHQVGRYDCAVDLMRRSIALGWNHPVAHSNLGEALRASGRLADAIAACRRAVGLSPDYPNAHNNLGTALKDHGELDEAIAAYRRALELKPDYPEALSNLGAALSESLQLDEAMAAYRRALELKPDAPEIRNNLGAALAGLGRFDEAAAEYLHALELKVDYPEAHNNLGIALRARGSLDEAVSACRRAVELKPEYPKAHNNLGAALADQGRFEEAVAAFRHALQLNPDLADAHNNLGTALRDLGLVHEGIAAYRRALQLKPEHAAAHSNLILALHLHPNHDTGTISDEHKRWSRQFSDPLKEFVLPNSNDPTVARRLRIGYVSPDFRDHPVGRYLLPLFERHDRERVEIVCYSGVTRPDWLTGRLRELAGRWRTTLGISDARLAEMIRADRVDILVDLALHTLGNRLPVFARQPAPVQVTWLAYPGSAGLHSIGYRLTDAHMDPPSETPASSAEEPVRLPDCWCCFQPAGVDPGITALPALSAKGVTFGSLNNFAKLNEGVLALWARVLEAAKRSRLLMLCPEGSARDRVRAFFDARGITTERVEFVSYLPRSDYFRLYQRIDVALDPFPCNGMTTTCDALWMGVPVITVSGGRPASRAGLSLLSSVGLGELAASSEGDYVRRAVELAGELPRLAELRAALRQRMRASPLMDAPRFARNVEDAYRSMWGRWCNASR